MITIGTLAKELGISVETVRFYERKGLIKQPKKPETGYRLYDTHHIDKVRFILRAKALGFTLDEVASLMSLSGSCADVESIGLEKLRLIREKINDLQRLEKIIQGMTDSCKANQDPTFCPIIHSLN